MTRHVDDATVAKVLDLRGVTDVTEAAFADLATGDADSTVRVRAAARHAMASAMAAALPRAGVTGGKLYATVAGRFTFLVALFDLDGRLVATFDGDSLTRIRTAAGTAVALRHLSAAAAPTAAIVGTGRQAVGQAMAVAQELDVADLRITGRSPEAARDIARLLTRDGVPARAVDPPAAAVTGADVVVTVTSADRPLFPGAAIADGALVCALGATKPTRRELDGQAVARADTVVVDSLAGARVECGDLIQAEEEGCFSWDRAVELAPVVAGVEPVRRAGDHVVLFESQGVALQDVAAAALAATRLGLLEQTAVYDVQ